MSSSRAKKWIVKNHQIPQGHPNRQDVEIIEEELPPLKNGEFLIEAQYISVDPYIRLWRLDPGSTVLSGQVGKVIETRHTEYSIGDLVYGNFGWVTHAVCDGHTQGHPFGLRKLDGRLHLPPSTALGILGLTGATAYFGLLEVCKPLKEGETLVVNAAAGAVGSAVGQIGKIKGMRVVGFAGSDEKVEYLKSIGFDAAYNYKTVSSLSDALAESCPNGIDVFFDNVGGEFFETMLTKMNMCGRVSVCGRISQYSVLEPAKVQSVSGVVLFKQLRIEGFHAVKWLPQWGEAFKEIQQWISEGKLQYKETQYEGFENVFDAFAGLFNGANIGKIFVKI